MELWQNPFCFSQMFDDKKLIITLLKVDLKDFWTSSFDAEDELNSSTNDEFSDIDDVRSPDLVIRSEGEKKRQDLIIFFPLIHDLWWRRNLCFQRELL